MLYGKYGKDSDEVKEAGKPIWEKLFSVSIANKNLQTTNELKMFGLPTVGNPVFDYQMHNQLIDVMITINDMVEYFKQGVTIRLVRDSDSKIIFDIISKYLFAWKNKLDRGINIAIAPLDDLLLLDRFAEKIYPYYKDHIKPDNSITTIINSLGGIGHRLIPISILSDTTLSTTKTKESYTSLAEVLSERVIGRSNGINVDNANTNNQVESTDSNKPFKFKNRWEQ